MIEKWYEVTCDYCADAINHYIGNKPSRQEMVDDGIIVVNNKHFCSNDCYNKYKNNSK